MVFLLNWCWFDNKNIGYCSNFNFSFNLVTCLIFYGDAFLLGDLQFYFRLSILSILAKLSWILRKCSVSFVSTSSSSFRQGPNVLILILPMLRYIRSIRSWLTCSTPFDVRQKCWLELAIISLSFRMASVDPREEMKSDALSMILSSGLFLGLVFGVNAFICVLPKPIKSLALWWAPAE